VYLDPAIIDVFLREPYDLLIAPVVVLESEGSILIFFFRARAARERLVEELKKLQTHDPSIVPMEGRVGSS